MAAPHEPFEARLPREWPYRADCPQRYTVNYGKYLSRGGRVHLEEDVKGFVAGDLNRGDMGRFYFFCLAFDQIVKEAIVGDFVELGVYKGNTAALLANFARRHGSMLYLLDTYEGFSERDIAGVDASANLQTFSDTSLEAVSSLVGHDNVKYVKGHFPGSASQLPPNAKYCLVHLDCDLYAPMASALEYFYPKIVPGGFLIVHDYSSLHWDGAEKAVDEFLASRSECAVPLPDDAGSVVIRKARSPSASDNWLLNKRRRLLSGDWVEAAHGGLSELLGQGWSSPEPWGVWGVGERHELYVATSEGLGEGIELDFDVQAALAGTRTEQTVEVRLGGQRIDWWTFSPQRNRSVRRLSVPKPACETSSSGLLCIEFRPKSVLRACDISPGSTDTRTLGLGLNRIRFAAPTREGVQIGGLES